MSTETPSGERRRRRRRPRRANVEAALEAEQQEAQEAPAQPQEAPAQAQEAPVEVEIEAEAEDEERRKAAKKAEEADKQKVLRAELTEQMKLNAKLKQVVLMTDEEKRINKELIERVTNFRSTGKINVTGRTGILG